MSESGSAGCESTAVKDTKGMCASSSVCTQSAFQIFFRSTALKFAPSSFCQMFATDFKELS